MKLWNKIVHANYEVHISEPEIYIDNKARGRSGHISYAYVGEDNNA